MIAFIFADLIILPILNIYRKYYGWRMMLFLLATFYATMAAAGLLTELLLDLLHLTPTVRDATVTNASVTLNYDTVLNAIFLIISAVLVVRFLRTGGVGMLRMMNSSLADKGGGSAHGTTAASIP